MDVTGRKEHAGHISHIWTLFVIKLEVPYKEQFCKHQTVLYRVPHKLTSAGCMLQQEQKFSLKAARTKKYNFVKISRNGLHPLKNLFWISQIALFIKSWTETTIYSWANEIASRWATGLLPIMSGKKEHYTPEQWEGLLLLLVLE